MIKLAWDYKSEVASNLTGKSGIKIIESEEELENLDLPIGSVVIVGSESSIEEILIKDCKLVTPDDMDPNTFQISNIDSFNTIENVQFEFPEWPLGDSLLGICIIVNKDFNTNPIIIKIVATEGNIMASYIDLVNQNMFEMFICSYNGPTTYEINQEGLDLFNQLFNELEWIYLGVPDFNVFPDTESLNLMLDFVNLFVKFRSGYPTKSDIYIKGDTWEKVDYKKYEKASNVALELLKKTNYPVIFPEAGTDGYTFLKPNTYNVCPCIGTSLNFEFIDDRYAEEGLSHINEYVIELLYNIATSIYLPHDIKWLNGDTPSFSEGKKYLISVVDHLGVWGEF